MSITKKKLRFTLLASLMLTATGALACNKPETEENYTWIYCSDDGFFKVKKQTGNYGGWFGGKTYAYGVIDSNGKVIVPTNYSYDEIGDFGEDGIIRADGNYYNKSGEKISKKSYYKAKDFNEGRASVAIKNGRNSYLYGYIDTQGNEIIPLKYGEAGHFNGGRAWVGENYKGPYGYINKSGKVVIPLQYENVHWFEEGTAAVKFNGKWMYIDTDGNVVMKMDQYQKVEPFFQGLAVVYDKHDKRGYIDTTGKEVIEPRFQKAYQFIQVGDKVLAKVKQSGTWGYINQSGDYVIKNIYDEVEPMHDNYVKVKSINGKYGILKNNGEEILPTVFDEIKQLHGYKYLYKLTKSNSDEVILFNTKTSEYNRQPYDEMGEYFGNMAWIKLNGKYGYVNDQARIVIEPKFSSNYNFNNQGLAKIKSGSQYNFINKSGNVISSQNYDEVSKFKEGLNAVSIGGKTGFIDTSGKLVIPAKYDSAYDFENGKSKVYIEKDGYYPSSFHIDKKGNVLVNRKAVSDYQKSLRVGSETPKGMVIEIKGDLVKIQDDSRQCSQRDYNNSCINWINTPTEKWVKRKTIVPRGYY